MVRRSLIMLLSLVIAGILSVVISIVIARYAGVVDFGVYSIVVSVQTVVTLFAGFGMGTAIAKFVAEARVRDEGEARAFAKVGFSLALLFSAVSSIVYVTLSGFIAENLYNEPAMYDLIPFSALVVFSTALFSTAFGIVQGYQRMRHLAFMQVAAPALALTGMIFLLPVLGIKGAFLGYFMAQCMVVAAALIMMLRSSFMFHSIQIVPGATVHAKALLNFAVPAVIASSVVTPVYWIGNTELTLVAGFGAMGFFAVSMVFYQSLTVLPNSIVIPLVPRISELSATKDFERIASLISRSMRFASVVMFPILLLVAIFSSYIVDLLYGKDYLPSGEAVYLMVTAAYFYSLAAVLGAAIVGLGRMWLGLGLNIAWATIFLVLVAVFVPSYGAKGLAFAFAMSYGAHLVNTFIVTSKAMRLSLRSSYKTSFAPTLFFIAGYLVFEESGSIGLIYRAAVFVAGAILIVLLGRDVVRSLVQRL